MKKFLALALSVTMVMGMSITSFAGSSDPTAAVEIGSTVKEATINVSVPTGQTFTINPYGLDANDDSTADPTLITTDHVITNLGKTGIQVSASVEGKVAGDAVFVTTDFSAEGAKAVTTKAIYLWATLGDAAATDAYEDNAFDWSTDAFNSKEDLVVSAKGAPLKKIVVLDAADGDSGNVSTAFHLGGAANGTAAEAWTTADTATINVVFNFLPTTYVAAAE